MEKISPKYLGVILAAGHGSRMGPFGELVPKPIAPICNKPLLAYQIEYMRAAGIEEIIVVIGHLGHRIVQALGDGADYGVRLRYVEQEKRLGLAHAVGQLERHLDRPFLLMLGDIFFEIPDITHMFRGFEESETAAMLAVKHETDPEAIKKNFSVHLREDGTVRRVIEKPRHIENDLKGCGLYLFDERIFEAIRRTPRTAMRDEYELTDSIQILIDYEYPVRVAPVVTWDMNLTYVRDLIECCVHELHKAGQASLIGRDCFLAGAVKLVDTVVGDRVRIETPGNFERCVIMPDAVISGEGPFLNTVITADSEGRPARHL